MPERRRDDMIVHYITGRIEGQMEYEQEHRKRLIRDFFRNHQINKAKQKSIEKNQGLKTLSFSRQKTRSMVKPR